MFSPYQQQVYQEQLEAKPGPAKEPVMVALLAEVLRLHEGQPAQLGGMEERPELNECEVTLGKREEHGLYTAHVSLKGQPEEVCLSYITITTLALRKKSTHPVHVIRHSERLIETLLLTTDLDGVHALL